MPAEPQSDPDTTDDPVLAATEAATEALATVSEAGVETGVLRTGSAVDPVDERGDARFGEGRGIPAVDRALYTPSEPAAFSLLWHLLGAVRGLRSDRDATDAVRLSVALGVESALVNGVLKSLVKRERPVADFDRPHNLRLPVTTSFPSGHASAAFCAAALLSDGRPRTRPLYYGLAAFVAASRVHVKIHHASDVLVGAAVGATVAAMVRRAWPRR